MRFLVAGVIQGAAEYGAMAGGSGSAPASGGTLQPGQLLDRLSGADPVVVALAVLGLLVVIGLLRTGRYRA